MLNVRLIYKIIGTLLFIEAVMMAVCTGVALFFHEDDVMAFIISVILTIMGGILFKYMGREADNSLGRRDAYLLVTMTWVVFSFFGMLPFIISGYVHGITNAFFETMSGFTTTGASVIDNVEKLPHGMLFWRSMTQWIGGLGIVFFTIAIIPSLVGGNVKVFSAEATGPIRAKMHPRLSTTAKWIWSIYLLLTIGCAVCFYFAGMGIFDCMSYAMTITATGGFATHSSDTGFYHDMYIDYTAILFMFLSGISFTLLYMTVFKGRLREFFRNSEFKLYISLILIATVIITMLLVFNNSYSIARATRMALFQVVSFLTTTGIYNDDVAQWPHIAWIILCICTFIGGCSGSTAGGFKCVRGVMVLNILRNEIKRILHPRAVLPVKVNGNNIPYSFQVTLLGFFALYILLCVCSYIIFTALGIDNHNAVAIALSCASNIGPSLGLEIGASMSWADLPLIGKWVCSGLMLMGRLEIFSVIVLFTPAFWEDN